MTSRLPPDIPPAEAPRGLSTRVRNWWRTIPVADPVDLYSAATLQLLLVLTGLYQCSLLLFGLRTGVLLIPGEMLPAVTGTAVTWSCFILLRRGNFIWAGRIFLVAGLALMMLAYVRWGMAALAGMQLMQMLTMMVCALLLGRRVLLGTTIWLALVVLGGAWRDMALWFYQDEVVYRALERAVVAIVGLAMAAAILDRSVLILRQNLELARQRGNDLARSRDQLQLEMLEKDRQRDQLVHAMKMENVGRLASGVAHDFNHLLSLILGYTGRGRRLDDVAGLKQALLGAETAARRAPAVSRRLLDFSRQEAARPEVFDPVEAVAQMEPMLRQLFDPSVAIQLDLQVPACRIHFDRAQFELVLLGIAANANQAMPEGGRFELALALTPQRLLQISARDTGSGMSEQVRARCLEPFFTTKPSGQGTGLGLAVAANLVAAAGGRIEVESRPGVGSTFRILLPTLATTRLVVVE